MADELIKRKENLLNILKTKIHWVFYILLAITIWFGAFIRTRNLKWLQGKYLSDPDSYLFYRYAQYIAEHGRLFVIDSMRYIPGYLDKATMQLVPYNTGGENVLVAYIIAYIYKFLYFFNKSVTIIKADIIYPVIFFSLAAIVFFFLVKKLFNTKIALLSTAILAIIPSFLFRTMSGVSDKEPVGIFFMFLTFLFYVLAFQSKNLKLNLIFGILSGIFTGLLGLVWGGVMFITIIIPVFALIEFLLGKLEKKDFYIYTLWLIFTTLILLKFTPRYTAHAMFASFTTGIAFFIFFIFLLDFILFRLNLKFNKRLIEKIGKKLPLTTASLIISLIIIIVISSIVFGKSFIPNQIIGAKTTLIYPMGMNRFVLTVAEAHQPYFVNWWSDFNWFFYLFFIGSVFLFYQTIKPIKKHKWWLTAVYTLFLSFFIFSRYDPNSKLNGTNNLSITLYLGSLIVFVITLFVFYLYTFYKNKEIFNEISTLDKKYTFVFVWFLLMIVAARGAIRLFFVFSPVISILASLLLIHIIENWRKLNRFLIFTASWLIIALISGFVIQNHLANILLSGAISTSIFAFKEKNTKKIIYTITTIVVIFLFVFAPFVRGSLINFARSSYNTGKSIGPVDYQWQKAMEWVDSNLPKDAVFAHWWDYGYWVQSMGHRATVLDGGNARGYWNHLMGRHVLTGQNEKEALEFLKTHNATHLLIVSEEIGKYPAYSSIGADANYDRYSQISTFSLDLSQTQETRDQTIYVYRGLSPLDEDLIYQGKVYKKNNAFIVGILLPIKSENQTSIEFAQPIAVLFYQNQQINIPLQCIFFEGQERNFEAEGLKGCLRIIPSVQDNQLNPIAAGLYVSEKVRRTLFTQMYLFDKNWPSFEEIYNDKNERPLLIYQGRLIGPLKIWKITYPEGIEWKPEYLTTDYPSEIV